MHFYLLTGIVVGFAASILAGRYGRNVNFWFVVCFLFPPTFLVLLALGENQECMPDVQNHAQAMNEYTECPYCAERIKKKAKVCKHCGRDIPPKEINI